MMAQLRAAMHMNSYLHGPQLHGEWITVVIIYPNHSNDIAHANRQGLSYLSY